MPSHSSGKQPFEYLLNITPGKVYLADPARRLPQKAQKGPTCWYYAFNYLRPRYGKGYAKGYKQGTEEYEARRVEKAVASGRKRLTEIWQRYKRLHSTAEQEKDLTEQLKTLKPTPPFKMLESSLKFDERSENLAVHLDIIKAIDPSFSTKDINVTSKTVTSLMTKYHRMAIAKVMQAYGLREDRTDRYQSLDAITDAMKLHGPLVCSGKIGVSFYRDMNNYQLRSVANRSVRFFADADHYYEQDINHMVILVGSKRNEDGAEYLFYIDPWSPSSDLSYQAISFDMFKSQVIPTVPGVHLVMPHPEYNKAQNLEQAIHLGSSARP